MIVVIADDLSGAAELAEVARRRGLAAEVQTRFRPGVDADVVCIDAATRALTGGEAARVTAAVVREIQAAAPEWVYLKFDSVLRGNVAVELRAALDETGGSRALLVPANPTRGRTIRGGRYLIDRVPLDATAFADDPEHPRRRAEVAALLGADYPAAVAVPDVKDEADVARLAAGADTDTLVAGAADFFEALLARRRAEGSAGGGVPDPARISPTPGPGPITLLVCGSRAAWTTRRGDAEARGVAVFDLEADPAAVVGSLERAGVALLGIGEVSVGAVQPPAALVSKLADCVKTVVGGVRPHRVLLEGGATAAAVVHRFGWTRLLAVAGGGGGTGALRPAGEDRPTLFIKPGSYAWPSGLWRSADR
jgi:uncharacterized protein YgbK (DUF1537 family)